MIGLSLEDLFEASSTPRPLWAWPSLTGVLLFASGRAKVGTRTVKQMGWRDALLIGLVKGMAITPGISRS